MSTSDSTVWYAFSRFQRVDEKERTSLVTQAGGPTAPPDGLCMTGVFYPQDPFAGLDVEALKRILLIVAPLVVVQIIQWRSGELFFMRLRAIPAPLKVVAYTLMIYLTLFLGGEPQAFVYFQF